MNSSTKKQYNLTEIINHNTRFKLSILNILQLKILSKNKVISS